MVNSHKDPPKKGYNKKKVGLKALKDKYDMMV